MSDTLSKAEVFEQLAQLIREGNENPWEEFEWVLHPNDYDEWGGHENEKEFLRRLGDSDYLHRRKPKPEQRTVWLVWDEDDKIQAHADMMHIPFPADDDKACKRVVITEGEFDDEGGSPTGVED